jgi:chemotaxis protein MotB
MKEKMQEVSDDMYSTVEELTQEYSLGDYVELSIDPEFRYVQLSMKGSILFDSGKANIKSEARPILSKIGDILTNFDGYIIEIIGHTDDRPMTSPTFKDNNWLSSARALNAAEFLIENNNLDPRNLKYSGRGEYEPIADNTTSEGRAKNRRIEIRIFNEYSGR